VHISDQCPGFMHFAQTLIVPEEGGGIDEEGVEERICPGGGGGGPWWNLSSLGASSWQLVGEAALFLKIPLRVGFHSSSFPCLVGALLIEVSFSSVVMGLAGLSQASISDSSLVGESIGPMTHSCCGLPGAVHSSSRSSGVGGGGGAIVELLGFLLMTTSRFGIFGFLLTDLLNCCGYLACC